MDEVKKAESHATSAAAFVEGGIQDACDDACSICLEEFSDNNPGTVTSCKHEFHLQCVLEWCQRSSNCPMCWQNITLKDPPRLARYAHLLFNVGARVYISCYYGSQELLEAIERERTFRLTPTRDTSIFHHPTLGNFELRHLPVGVDTAELEDRIIQHLAAAATMGRTHRMPRREGSIRHSSSQAHEFVVFPAQVNEYSATSGREESHSVASSRNNSLALPASTNNEDTEDRPSSVPRSQTSTSLFRTVGMPSTGRGVSNYNRNSTVPSFLTNQDRAGPSESPSFSDTWRSRFSSLSIRYKESIAKSTKELKEKLFSRSSSMTGLGSEVRREVNVGIATVTRMMERLEARDNNRADQSNGNSETHDEMVMDGNRTASVASSSVLR